MKKFLIFACPAKLMAVAVALCSLLSSLALAAPSPVVQVIAYKEPLGMYFSLQGWGSGSIIDSAGHILTNNHVVDDGFGGISDDFSICLTEDPALPPKCHYTASVVTRDPDKDIALLQLDPKDIFGNVVNFSSFIALPIDYTYTPAAGDTVNASGYPWVWANTITETQGIVSGTYEYNGNTYLKTDTLIAGGNSGGPLVRNGKMIGVNTFLIGGFSDPALGYSLSIPEAQDFIQDGLVKSTYEQTNSPQFAPFLQSINQANQTQKIVDNLITIHFPKKYNIATYIPGSYIDGIVAEESNTAVYAFSFVHLNTPKLTTPEEIRYFLSGQSFFPFWQDVKFKTITIGGQSFYEVDTLGNTGGDKTKTLYVYFKIVDGRHLLLLQLATPFSNESTYDAIQKNISTFLAGISFPAQFSFSSSGSVDVVDAGISLKPAQNSLVDFRSNFFPYSGVISQLMTTYDDLLTVRTYLGNLWSYAQISIVPNSFYTQDTDPAALLEKLKETSDFSENYDSSLISYKWHEWFLVCDNTSWSQVTDEKNTSHSTASCETIFLVWEDDSHFVSLYFLTEKRKKAEILDLMKQYLDSTLIIESMGTTDFGTNSARLTYTDVENQTQEFRESLAILVKYGILTPRAVFDGEHPMTWAEYIRLHIWAIYHKRLTDHIDPFDPVSPTFESVLKKLPIDHNAYVNSSDRATFELMLLMRLAWVEFPTYSAASLEQFRLQRDTKYHAEWQQIEDFEYAYFRGTKMSPTGGSYYNSGYYTADSYITYNPITGLSFEPTFDTDSIRFGLYTPTETAKKALDAELACTKSSTQYFSSRCYKKRQEYVWSFLSYSVLTKWQAVSELIPSIDFALWDDNLAKKKTVKIEEEQEMN